MPDVRGEDRGRRGADLADACGYEQQQNCYSMPDVCREEERGEGGGAMQQMRVYEQDAIG